MNVSTLYVDSQKHSLSCTSLLGRVRPGQLYKWIQDIITIKIDLYYNHSLRILIVVDDSDIYMQKEHVVRSDKLQLFRVIINYYCNYFASVTIISRERNMTMVLKGIR